MPTMTSRRSNLKIHELEALQREAAEWEAARQAKRDRVLAEMAAEAALAAVVVSADLVAHRLMQKERALAVLDRLNRQWSKRTEHP